MLLEDMIRKIIMKIPFGKFKGKELVTFIHQDELKYLEWFLENCKETISKFPAFEKYLEENFDYQKYVEPTFTTKDYKDSSGISTDGIMINNLKEYKTFISKLYNTNWRIEPAEKVYKVFGKPEEYPFVITLRQNSLNTYGGKEIHKIYIKDKPSLYYYSEETY